jgi:hypothetical protein
MLAAVVGEPFFRSVRRSACTAVHGAPISQVSNTRTLRTRSALSTHTYAVGPWSTKGMSRSPRYSNNLVVSGGHSSLSRSASGNGWSVSGLPSSEIRTLTWVPGRNPLARSVIELHAVQIIAGNKSSSLPRWLNEERFRGLILKDTRRRTRWFPRIRNRKGTKAPEPQSQRGTLRRRSFSIQRHLDRKATSLDKGFVHHSSRRVCCISHCEQGVKVAHLVSQYVLLRYALNIRTNVEVGGELFTIVHKRAKVERQTSQARKQPQLTEAQRVPLAFAFWPLT